MSAVLTLTYVRDTLRSKRVSIRKTPVGDYRVTLIGVGRKRAEAMAYYTECLHDAYNTGLTMAEARK